MSAASRPTQRHVVGAIDDLPPGTRRIVKIPTTRGEIEIGVFNVGGRFVAFRNLCPHAGAPVCEGTVSQTVPPALDGKGIPAGDSAILRCPWHGWEFDLFTGEHLVGGTTSLRPRLMATDGASAPGDGLEAVEIETRDGMLWALT